MSVGRDDLTEEMTLKMTLVLKSWEFPSKQWRRSTLRRVFRKDHWIQVLEVRKTRVGLRNWKVFSMPRMWCTKGKKNYSVGMKICRSQPLQAFVRDFKTIRYPFLKYRRKTYIWICVFRLNFSFSLYLYFNDLISLFLRMGLHF